MITLKCLLFPRQGTKTIIWERLSAHLSAAKHRRASGSQSSNCVRASLTPGVNEPLEYKGRSLNDLLGQKSLHANTDTCTCVYLKNKNRNYGGSQEEGDGVSSLAGK